MAFATPAIFRGSSKEDAAGWLRHAVWWLSTTRAGQAGNLTAKLHQIAIFLHDEAETWFTNLRIMNVGESYSISQTHHEGENIVRSWEDFVRLFQDRFRRDESERTSDVTALMQSKQRNDQSVEEFVAAIRKRGTIITATQQEIYMAIVSGLRPSIKPQIMQFSPTTITDILRQGKIAERYPMQTVEGTPKQAKNVDTEQLLKAINEIRTKQQDRSHNQTPPRMRFNNNSRDQDRSSSPYSVRNNSVATESMRTSGYQTSADCRSDDDSRSQSPCPDDYSTQYDNYSRDHGTFQHRDRESSSFTQRPWSGHDAHGMTLSNGTNNSRCQNCAKPHMASDRCPARGTVCGNCGKLNHWKAACRSALSYSGFATRTDWY